ncbi:MAG TPA: hypothetical protein VKU94_04875 [Geobacterales bacterium]|nr:hypothetical protein [Geobacterales bacterium]
MDLFIVLYHLSLLLALSLVPALLSAGLNRFLISRYFGIDRYRRIMREIREFDSQLLQATRNKDNAKIEKLQAKRPYIDKMRSQTFKVTMISTMVMLLFYYLFFIYIFTMLLTEAIPIYFPLISADFFIPPYYWYIICLFFVSLLINRKLGIYY